MFGHSWRVIGTARPSGLAAVAASLLVAMGHRWRERRALGRLDERLLNDIGLSRDRASAEVGKMPWQD
ncbi:MAG: DUF1127 domain-containing protein [Alphaproteobacteria bacterium]